MRPDDLTELLRADIPYVDTILGVRFLSRVTVEGAIGHKFIMEVIFDFPGFSYIPR